MYPLSFKYFGFFFIIFDSTVALMSHNLSNFYIFSSYFIKFLPNFLSLPLSSVARFLVFYVISHDTLSPSMGRQLAICVFSVCVSQWQSRDSLQAAFSSCVNTAGKLRVDRGSCELFSFPLCVLECCSENHGFRLSLHNGAFHVHV